MLECFRGGTVVAHLASREKYEAIRELIQKAPVFDGIQERIAEAVIARERLLSTGLGRGVAVAHGTTDAAKGVIIALGISEAGVDYGAVDDAPVHLLFVIANPPGMQREYLLALAAVTRLLRDDSFRDSLRQETPLPDLEQRICDAFSESLKNYLPATA